MIITLYYNQLEHTILQVLHRAGASVQDVYQRFLVQMDEDKSDAQLIRRLIRKDLAKEKTMLRKYLTRKEEQGDDMLRETEGAFPFNIDLDGDGQATADLLHWFIVWDALADIYRTFGLDTLASRAADEATEAKELIQSELIELAMPRKRRRPLPEPERFAPQINMIELR